MFIKVFPDKTTRTPFLLFYLILMLIPALFNAGYFYTISLEKGYEKQNFFLRKKDEIILLLIGSGVTLLYQWIYKLFIK